MESMVFVKGSTIYLIGNEIACGCRGVTDCCAAWLHRGLEVPFLFWGEGEFVVAKPTRRLGRLTKHGEAFLKVSSGKFRVDDYLFPS
jgi:hypothetical protein